VRVILVSDDMDLCVLLRFPSRALVLNAKSHVQAGKKGKEKKEKKNGRRREGKEHKKGPGRGRYHIERLSYSPSDDTCPRTGEKHLRQRRDRILMGKLQSHEAPIRGKDQAVHRCA
jgi:hypothetical protein